MGLIMARARKFGRPKLLKVELGPKRFSQTRAITKTWGREVNYHYSFSVLLSLECGHWTEGDLNYDMMVSLVLTTLIHYYIQTVVIQRTPQKFQQNACVISNIKNGPKAHVVGFDFM